MHGVYSIICELIGAADNNPGFLETQSQVTKMVFPVWSQL
jgi:hypothetical protein